MIALFLPLQRTVLSGDLYKKLKLAVSSYDNGDENKRTGFIGLLGGLKQVMTKMDLQGVKQG